MRTVPAQSLWIELMGADSDPATGLVHHATTPPHRLIVLVTLSLLLVKSCPQQDEDLFLEPYSVIWIDLFICEIIFLLC